jgi:hypothetical protein
MPREETLAFLGFRVRHNAETRLSWSVCMGQSVCNYGHPTGDRTGNTTSRGKRGQRGVAHNGSRGRGRGRGRKRPKSSSSESSTSEDVVSVRDESSKGGDSESQGKAEKEDEKDSDVEWENAG